MLFDDHSCKVSCVVSFNATVNSYFLYGQASCLLTNVLYRVRRFDFCNNFIYFYLKSLVFLINLFVLVNNIPAAINVDVIRCAHS